MNKIFYILFLSLIIANNPPIWLDIPTQNIEEDCNPCTGFPLGFPFDLENYVVDFDGDDLSISMPEDIEGATFIIDGFILDIVVDENWNGSIDFELTAFDGTDSSSTEFSVEVTPVNDEPEWIEEIPDQTIEEDCDPCTGFPIDLNQFVIDADEDLLTISIPEDIEGATFTIDGFILGIVVDEHWYGLIDFDITASDGTLASSAEFSVEVTSVNDEPEWTEIPDQTIEEDCDPCAGFPINLNDYLFDPDFDLTITASDVNGASFSINDDLELSIIPDQDFNTISSDPITLTLTASDADYSTDHSFNIDITNDIPQIIDQNTVAVNEDCALNEEDFNSSCDESNAFQLSLDDININLNEDDELTLIIDESAIDYPGYTTDGALGIILNQDYDNTIQVPVYVEDSFGDSSQTIDLNIIVVDINDVPVWTDIYDKTIDEDCNSCTGFPINLNEYLFDPDSDLDITTSEVNGASFSINNALELSIIPDQDFNTIGSDPITLTLTASDEDFEIPEEFNITITGINDSPIFTESMIVEDSIYEDCQDESDVLICIGLGSILCQSLDNQCEWFESAQGNECRYVQDADQSCDLSNLNYSIPLLSEYAYDVDNDFSDLTFSINSSASEFYDAVIDEDDNLIITPDHQYNNDIVLELKIGDLDTDEYEETFSLSTFTLDILDLNDEPYTQEPVIDTQDLLEDFGTIEFEDLSIYFEDYEDGDDLIYSYEILSGPTDVVDLDIDDNKFTITSIDHQYTRESENEGNDDCDDQIYDNPINVKITANDLQNRAEASFDFYINVSSVNDVPYLTPEAESGIGFLFDEDCGAAHNQECGANYDEWFNVDLTDYILTDDKDAQCTDLYQYTVESISTTTNEDEHQFEIENGILYVAPFKDFSEDSIELEISIDDNRPENSLSAQNLLISIEIEEINDSPYVTEGLISHTIDEEGSITFDFYQYVIDVDNSITGELNYDLSITDTDYESYFEIIDFEEGDITLKPIENFNKDVSFNIIVTDADGLVTDNQESIIELTINQVNDPVEAVLNSDLIYEEEGGKKIIVYNGLSSLLVTYDESSDIDQDPDLNDLDEIQNNFFSISLTDTRTGELKQSDIWINQYTEPNYTFSNYGPSVYEISLEVTDDPATPDPTSDTDTIELRIGQPVIELTESYSFVTTDSPKIIEFTISDDINGYTSILTPGDYLTVSIPPELENCFFNPLVPGYPDIESNYGDDYKLEFQSYENNYKDALFMIEDPDNTDYQEFVPDDIEYSIDFNLSISGDTPEFDLSLSLSGSDYSNINGFLADSDNGDDINISSGTPTLNILSQVSNITEDEYFVASDQTSLLSYLQFTDNATAATFQDSLTIKIPDEINNFLFDENQGISVTDITIESYRVSDTQKELTMFFSNPNADTPVDTPGFQFEIYNISVDFSGLTDNRLEYIEPFSLELKLNDIGNVDATTDNTIRIGQPTVVFDNPDDQNEVFILSDDQVTLSTIIYSENQVASANHAIEISFPNGSSGINFIDNGHDWTSEEYLGGTGDYHVSSVSHSNDRIIYYLDSPMLLGETLEIYNLVVGQFSGELDGIYLEVDVNPYGDQDTNMEGDDYIRIGQPTIDLENSQVFIYSDPDGCDQRELDKITITDGQYPVIRKSEGITVTLPDHLRWDDISTDLTDFESLVSTSPENLIDKLDLVSMTFNNPDQYGYKSLFIPVVQDFESASDKVFIENTYVKAISQTFDNGADTEARLTLDVNDGNFGATSYDGYSENYAAVDDIIIFFDSRVNSEGFRDNSYVLSDEDAYFNSSSGGTIRIWRTDGSHYNENDENSFEDEDGDDSFLWPTLKNRPFKITLPPNFYISDISSTDPINSGNIINYSDDSNFITFQTTDNIGDNIELSGTYLLNETQPAQPISLSVNSNAGSNENIDNTSSVYNLRIGQPSISLDNQDEYDIFVLSDQEVILSTIIYQEHGDAGSSIDYFDVTIPDNAQFNFSNDDIQVSGDEGSHVNSCSRVNGDKTIRCSLNSPLDPDDSVELGNVKINFSQEVENTRLYARVNGDENDSVEDNQYTYSDATMSLEDHIRIGNPTVKLEDRQVFVLSDPDFSEKRELNTITIKEGSVPVIRSLEGIKVTLPDYLRWDDINVPESSLDIQGPAGKLDEDGANYTDIDQYGYKSLFIPVIEYFEDGEEVTIEDGFVKTVARTPYNTDANTTQTKLTFNVNDGNFGDNNYDNYSENYAVVDDILLSFSPQFDNDPNNAYVLSDAVSDMRSIYMQTLGSFEDGTGSWPIFSDRSFELTLPDNIYVQSLSIDSNTGIAEVENLEISDNTISFDANINDYSQLTLSGTYLLHALQPAQPISLSLNSVSSDPNAQSMNVYPDQFTDDINELTTLRVGAPSVEFINSIYNHDTFIYSDGRATISDIRYFENGQAGTAVDYIEILIPDDKDFFFDDISLAASEIEFDGNAADKVSGIDVTDTDNDGKLIKIILIEPLSSDNELIIKDIPIVFGDLNQYPNANSIDPTYLKFKVNKEDDESVQDCALENDDYIAIGDPSINVNQNQIFIKSEPINSDSHLLADIVIAENQVPVINNIDNVVIYLPENFHIYDGSVLGLPYNISWDADLNGNDPFDSCEPSDNVLTCMLSDDFIVQANEIFRISGLRIIPQDNLSSIADLYPSRNSYIGVKLNNRNDNSPELYNYYSSNFSVLDDIKINFSTDRDQIYTLSDQLDLNTDFLPLDPITVSAEVGAFDGYYTLENRPFRLKLPTLTNILEPNCASSISYSPESCAIEASDLGDDNLLFFTVNSLPNNSVEIDLQGIIVENIIERKELKLTSYNIDSNTPDEVDWNVMSDNSIRVGQPSIDFVDSFDDYPVENIVEGEVFVLSDNLGTLSKIIYKEDDQSGASSDFGIIISMPTDNLNILDSIAFSASNLSIIAFASNNYDYDDNSYDIDYNTVNNGILTDPGLTGTSVLTNGQLYIPLGRPLIKGESLEISNLEIALLNQIQNVALELYINDPSHHGTNAFDAIMESEFDQIRIGDPQVSIDSDRTFILSDDLASETLELPRITIAEKSVPAIRESDDIQVKLPPEILWRDDNLDDIEFSMNENYEISDYIETDPYSADNSILNIRVTQDFEANQELYIDKVFVEPVIESGGTNFDVDGIDGSVAIEINKKKDTGYDYFSEQNNLFVNNIYIDFLSLEPHEDELGNGKHAFVLSDAIVELSDIKITSSGEGNIFDENRLFKIELPEHIDITSNLTVDCDGNSNDISEPNPDGSTLVFSTNILSTESEPNGCEVLRIQTPELILNDIQSAAPVNVYTSFANDTHINNSINASSCDDASLCHTIRVGQPLVTFINNGDGEVFVSKDIIGTLSNIQYSETVAVAQDNNPVTTAVDYIDIVIPSDDQDNIYFYEPNLGEVSAVNGVVLPPACQNAEGDFCTHIRFQLDQSYNYQGPFNFDKVPISWVSDNQEINETALEFSVNAIPGPDDISYDTKMNNSENYIRVGNPSIDIEDNHVFILSDQHTLGVTELALSTITITEGQVPVMRSSEGITVHLPNSLQDGIYPLEWDDTHMENFSITLITEAEDDDKIEGFNFSDDKRSLNINFVADKQLEPGDVIEIKGAFVKPTSRNWSNVPDDHCRLSIEVNKANSISNDNNDGYDNIISMDNSYLAVDDIEIGFNPIFTNDLSIAYVQSDVSVPIGAVPLNEGDQAGLIIKKLVGTNPSNGNSSDWAPLADRNFRIELPEYIEFDQNDINIITSTNSPIPNELINFDDDHSIITFSSDNVNINSDTEIIITGSYLLDQTNLQEAKKIDLSVNTNEDGTYGESNIETTYSLRTGDPKLFFNQRQMFSLAPRDVPKILDRITYQESSVASGVDYIRISLPDAPSNLKFDTTADPIETITFGGDVAVDPLLCAYEDNGKTLYINLNQAFAENQSITIEGLALDFSDENFDVAENFHLYANVNSNLGIDYDMNDWDNDVYIRVGQPIIELTDGSTGDHVFISTETDAEFTEDITICSGSVSTINPEDDLFLKIPDTSDLKWNDTLIVFSSDLINPGEEFIQDISVVDDGIFKTLKIEINDIYYDFPENTCFTIKGASEDNDGLLFINAENAIDNEELQGNLILNSCNEDSYEDSRDLIVAKPDLIIEEEFVIISNRSDIDGNEFEYFMEGITFTDDNDNPTIKEGQFIRIYLPEDFEEGCADDNFEWAISNEGTILIQGSEGGLPKAKVSKVDGKELEIEISQDFTGGESFDLDGIAVYSPSCRLAGSDGDGLSFSIRNYTNAAHLNSEGSNYFISKPEIKSIDRQIFFIEQDCEECEDNQNIVDFGKINLSEDPIKPAFFNHIQSFTIHLPDELEWFTDANILTQEGDDAGSIDPIPSFDSDDPQTVTISISNPFTSFVDIKGLKVRLNQTTDFNRDLLNDNITFSFNNRESENIVDSEAVYVGKILFHTNDNEQDDPNIFIKNDRNENDLNKITIQNMDPNDNNISIVKGYSLCIPPELEVTFDYLDASSIGDQDEGVSDIIQAEPENFESDQKHYCIDIRLLGNSIDERLIQIDSLLNYINHSTFESESIESKLTIEPILEPMNDGFGTYARSGSLIEDKVFSYLDATILESENDNLIFLSTEGKTNSEVNLNNITIQKDGFNILDGLSHVSITLEDTECSWYNYQDNNDQPDINPSNTFTYNTNDDKDLILNVGSINDEIVTISNLMVECNGGNRTGQIRLKEWADNGSDLSSYGIDRSDTKTDIITIDVDENTAIWLDGSARAIINNIRITDSDILESDSNEQSFYLDFGDFVRFDSLTINNLKTQNFSYDSLSISETPYRLGFFGVSDNTDTIDDNFIVSNLDFLIDSSAYYPSNNDYSNYLKLFSSESSVDNYVNSENEISFNQSTFFSIPSLYHDNVSDKDQLEFVVYNAFDIDSDTENLAFRVNNDDILIDLGANLQEITDYPMPTYITDNLAYNLFNDPGKLTLWRIDLDSDILDLLNREIDNLLETNESISISIVSIESETSLNRISRTNHNDSEISFYPGIDPSTEYTFISDNRAINPDSSYIVIESLNGNQYTPKITINSAFDEQTSIISSDKIIYSASDSTYSIELDSDYLDNIYQLSLYIEDENEDDDLDRSSMPLTRYYYIDRKAPELYSLSPWVGSNTSGNGHDITIYDQIGMTFMDSSIFFDENSIDHMISGIIESLNLNHIFKNENYIEMNFNINDDEIDNEKNINDTLFYDPSINDKNFYNYDLRIQNVLSGIDFDSGEFKIYLKVKDQAGNINNEEIAYTIQTNMSDIVSNFINYPNPFSPLTGEPTSFRYSIVDQDIVSTQSGNLMIYDLSGNLIYLRKLYPEELTLGTHEVVWDGKTNSGIILADGVYFGMIDFDNYKTRIHKIAIINEK